MTALASPPPVRRRLRSAAGRLTVVAVLALLLASLRLPGRLPSLCTLRGLTGVPCPFCGGTTALVELGGGDVVGAVAASPLTVTAAAAVVLAPLAAGVAPGRWPRSARLAALGGLLAGAEVWQLARFGFIG